MAKRQLAALIISIVIVGLVFTLALSERASIKASEEAEKKCDLSPTTHDPRHPHDPKELLTKPSDRVLKNVLLSLGKPIGLRSEDIDEATEETDQDYRREVDELLELAGLYDPSQPFEERHRLFLDSEIAGKEELARRTALGWVENIFEKPVRRLAKKGRQAILGTARRKGPDYLALDKGHKEAFGKDSSYIYRATRQGSCPEVFATFSLVPRGDFGQLLSQFGVNRLDIKTGWHEGKARIDFGFAHGADDDWVLFERRPSHGHLRHGATHGMNFSVGVRFTDEKQRAFLGVGAGAGFGEEQPDLRVGVTLGLRF